MEFRQDFQPLALDELHGFAVSRRDEGWRYVQTLAVLTEEGVDLVYSFMKCGHLDNRVVSIARDAEVPSITDVFLAAFVFENEIHDLFGVDIRDIAIDFEGNFYRLANEAPMTIISPEQAAARQKAKKAAAAKAAKSNGAAKPAASDEDMEAKLAAMDPEKAAKVRAAMEAKAKKEAAAKDAELEAKLAAMDPEKAAKVRAAMEAKAKKAAASEGGE